MELVIKYHGVYAGFAGVPQETIQIEGETTLEELLHLLGEIHGKDFLRQLKDAAIFTGHEEGGFKMATMTDVITARTSVIITPPIVGG